MAPNFTAAFIKTCPALLISHQSALPATQCPCAHRWIGLGICKPPCRALRELCTEVSKRHARRPELSFLSRICTIPHTHQKQLLGLVSCSGHAVGPGVSRRQLHRPCLSAFLRAPHNVLVKFYRFLCKSSISFVQFIPRDLIFKTLLKSHLGGSVVEHLPSAHVVTQRSWD